MRYAANCRISGPIATTATPDVDFGGLMWSYKYGLVYPPAAVPPPPIRLPSPPPTNDATGKGRAR